MSQDSQALAVPFAAQLGNAELGVSVDDAHMLPWQQVAQLAEQPWHRPVEADSHIAPEQLAQVPDLPHESVVITDAHLPRALQQPLQPDAPLQTQTPFWQTSPTPQAAPEPHRQPVAPNPQLSASGPQGEQLLPVLRQLVTVFGTHWPVDPPRQHPDGHELLLQTQVLPAPQAWPAAQLGPVPHKQVPPAPHALARWGPHSLHAAVGPLQR